MSLLCKQLMKKHCIFFFLLSVTGRPQVWWIVVIHIHLLVLLFVHILLLLVLLLLLLVDQRWSLGVPRRPQVCRIAVIHRQLCARANLK